MTAANSNQNFKWDEKTVNIARELSTGIRTNRDIAAQFEIHESTISKWKQNPEFMEKVNQFTLDHELGTRAGLLREAMYGLHIKEKQIENDRSSHLDYLKEIGDLQGLKKQKIEHSGSSINTIRIVMKKEEEERK